jgi:hypothetical protein
VSNFAGGRGLWTGLAELRSKEAERQAKDRERTEQQKVAVVDPKSTGSHSSPRLHQARQEADRLAAERGAAQREAAEKERRRLAALRNDLSHTEPGVFALARPLKSVHKA